MRSSNTDLTLSPATTVTSQGWSRNLCCPAVVGELSTNRRRRIIVRILEREREPIALARPLTLRLAVHCSGNLSLQAVNSNNPPCQLSLSQHAVCSPAVFSPLQRKYFSLFLV